MEKLHRLDMNWGMTSTYDQLRQTFLDLLDQRLEEQAYQGFLEQNTRFIPREFIQNHGLHFSVILRKLRFGSDYISDFFYMSKSSDDWNLVFVEIEKPSSRYFRGASTSFSPEFQSALQQIGTWRAWLSNSDNLASLLSNTLAPLHLPAGMRRNPGLPKYVLVHGRRDEYGGNDTRRALVRAQEREDFKILSFDSLAESLEQKRDCYIGVRRNHTIELKGDVIVDRQVFGWIEPTQFTVSAAMQAALRTAGGGPVTMRIEGQTPVNALPWVADRIGVV